MDFSKFSFILLTSLSINNELIWIKINLQSKAFFYIKNIELPHFIKKNIGKMQMFYRNLFLLREKKLETH